MTIVKIETRSITINHPEKANREKRRNDVTDLDLVPDPSQDQRIVKVGTAEPAKIEGAGNDRIPHRHLLHQLQVLIKS